MRPILRHELKLVDELLTSEYRQRVRMPEAVVGAYAGGDAAMTQPVVLNESFTTVFEDDVGRELRLVGCALGLPGTIGNELLLVEDGVSHDLVFLEFMGPSLSLLRSPIDSAANRLSGLREKMPCGVGHDLICDFELLRRCIHSSQHSAKPKALSYCRFLMTKSAICFFLGTSKHLIFHPWDAVNASDLIEGKCQYLSSGKDAAVEGWLDYHVPQGSVEHS